MKIVVILALLLLCAAGVSADLIMVQEEEQIHAGGTNKMTMTIRVKGEKFRVDLDPVGMSTIVDHATGKTVVLFNSAKTYRETSPGQEKESVEFVTEYIRESGKKIPDERPCLHATGKKDTINGWNVEEYVAESPTMKRKMTYWFARGLDAFNVALRKGTKNPRTEQLNRQFPDPESFPGLPVVIVIEAETPRGKLTSTTRVLSVKEAKLEDSEFAPPPNYKKE